MAPKQKTFELIPDLPGLGQAQQQQPPAAAAAAAAVQSKPPMTTKQAKKLYRQKSKGPKLSKAEQRRIDLMEQDRIRKEFDKEKAQARARAARDKKKAKEDKEKDEKRRKGLPLVDVHPSQDTISRFISRLGFGGKNNTHLETVQEADSESATEVESDADGQNEPSEVLMEYHVQGHSGKAPGKENEDPTVAPGDSAARPAKRRKLGQPDRNLLDRMIHIPSQRSVGAVARIAQEMEMESWTRPSSIDTDDPANETMLEDQLIADVELASSKSATRSSPKRQSSPRELLLCRDQPSSHASLTPKALSPPPQPPPPPRPQSRPQPPRPPKSQACQLPAGTRIPPGNLPATDQFRTKHVEDACKRPASSFVPVGKRGPAMRCTVAAKSPAPPKFKPPAGDIVPRSGRPRFLPKPTKTAAIPIPVQASPTYAGSRRPAIKTGGTLPTSTQLLVINHVDELFPSPSQEARELYEDQQTANTVKVSSDPPPLLHSPPLFTAEHVDHQDGRLTATAPGRPASLPKDHSGGNVPPEFHFLATQDLILSSQDMEELDTPKNVRMESASWAMHVASNGNSLSLLSAKLAPPDENIRVVSAVQAPKDATSLATRPSTEAIEIDLNCCHLMPASTNENEARGKPLGQSSFKEVTQCATQAHIRPRSQCLQVSSNGISPLGPNLQQDLSSPRNKRGKHDGQGPLNGAFDCRPPSFHCPHSPAKHSQADSPSDDSGAAHRSQNGCAMPPASPPKKRMFGSSGPGAEVLVAMERSYKQNLAEERRRKEDRRAQESKASAAELAGQDLVEIVEDDLLDDDFDTETIQIGNPSGLPDDLGKGDGSPAIPRLQSPIGSGPNAGARTTGRASDTRAEPVASQETDYGDFDFEAEEELDILADITWAGEELSDV